MNVLVFATLMITGFVACAEFGSYAFVHPVIRRLPQTEHTWRSSKVCSRPSDGSCPLA